MSGSDSDSSTDDLGLFSFANKKVIVADVPVSITPAEPASTQDFGLFRRNDKRKRTAAPLINENDLSLSQETGNGDAAPTEDDNPPIDDKTREKDAYIESIMYGLFKVATYHNNILFVNFSKVK